MSRPWCFVFCMILFVLALQAEESDADAKALKVLALKPPLSLGQFVAFGDGGTVMLIIKGGENTSFFFYIDGRMEFGDDGVGGKSDTSGHIFLEKHPGDGGKHVNPRSALEEAICRVLLLALRANAGGGEVEKEQKDAKGRKIDVEGFMRVAKMLTERLRPEPEAKGKKGKGSVGSAEIED